MKLFRRDIAGDALSQMKNERKSNLHLKGRVTVSMYWMEQKVETKEGEVLFMF